MAWCLVKHRDNFTFTFYLYYKLSVGCLATLYRLETLFGVDDTDVSNTDEKVKAFDTLRSPQLNLFINWGF
jgi:hypothetical protein